jgi:hypothetical protein
MTQEQASLSPQEEFDRLTAQITNIVAQERDLEDRAVLLNDQKQQLMGVRSYITQKAQAEQAQNLSNLDVPADAENTGFDEETDDSFAEVAADRDSVSRSAEYPE